MSNILFISPNPVWGGAATANMAIAQMLKDNDHCVIVNDEYFEKDMYDRLEINHLPIHQKKFSDRSLLWNLVHNNGIDCIIWSPLVAVYFYNDIKRLKKLGIKQIAIVHSLSLTNNLKGKIMDFLVSLALAEMSTIVYVSKYTMNSWNKFRAIRKTKAKKEVIHNLVDITALKHIYNNKKPRIGFVGRLSQEKRPQIFCELSNNSDFDYCIYGDGPMMSELKTKFKGVSFKGLCHDTNKIYADIDILVMTSEFENCPMVILEAQAFGIPCIAPNVGGIPEIIENGVGGILYEPHKSDKIIEAINTIISNYSYFSTNSYRNSEKYTPKTAIIQWEKVLG